MLKSAMAENQTKSATRANLFGSAGKSQLILSLLLVVLTLLVYNPIVHNGFVSFDDPAYIIGNQHVRAGLSWQTVKWAFISTENSNWHPLTWLSHALDWQLFGNHAAGHHYVSVLLHASCVVLLFLFLQSATGHIWRSIAVATLFAVHPINVESVAWISERKNLLCTVFFLLALLSYLGYTKNLKLKNYLLVALWFALGLMSKPMVITLPFVLLLFDYWPLKRMKSFPGGSQISSSDVHNNTQEKSFGFLILEKVPLFLLAAASGLITVIAQRDIAIKTQYSLSEKTGNAVVSYCRYIEKAIWPAKLAVLYPHPMNAIPAWQVVISTILISAITIGVALLRRHCYLAVGWFFFLGTLIPVIGLIQVGEQAMADRYAYIPFIGLFVAIVWGIADLAHEKRVSIAYLALLTFLVVSGFIIKTHIQISYWHDSTALWSHALDVTKNNFVAEDSVGAELIQRGKIKEAIEHLKNAARINPKDAFSWLDLGVCEKDQGNIAAATEHFERALQLSSDSSLRSTAFNNLGSIYRMTGNYPQALQNYKSALHLNPENEFALIGLGLISQRLGDFAEAVEYYSQAVRVAPSDISYLLLSQALSKDGQSQNATSALVQAQKMSRNWQSTQQSMQKLLSEQP